ncbi:hypothetical protein [Paraburkholderia megapolitana]|uniref:NlpC/P60 family protein n=1 Tax=Paraburkholderia megapolitana TaxID=420953 RepID=A0A1I3QHH3_9BURK|nr:hypothetical protein [Paraburkholderia megapolitana]SFJ33135.1 hypothetical protein SAMN05192543_106368 [Paraburkholderia megapolitana]
MADKKDIKTLCENHWDDWKGDCSGFLKAVAADLGLTLTGDANALVGTMSGAPWSQLGTDKDKAVAYAGLGYLVVAGLKATPHGHVAIIMPGVSKPYPLAYWGRYGGSGRKNTALNYSWSHKDLASVQYYAIRP